MNIIFMGTPDFAVPSLKRLIEEHNVTAVFTQPDRPKGRGNKISITPVKEIALKNNIPVYQPLKIKSDPEAVEAIRKLNPDFIIVVAFGQILPKEVLEIPKYGCINLHASLLPKYRGAAPVNWAIIEGESKSGNTTMLMDAGLDTGDMLLKSEVEIGEKMNSGELHDILMNEGAELLIKTVKGVASGEILPEKQDDSKSCYAPMLDKTVSKLDWNNESRVIFDKIRGLSPKPSALTNYKNVTIKVYEAEIGSRKSDKNPGTILEVSREGIEVSTKDGSLILTKIQFPGGKPLTVDEYIKGNSIEKGVVLE